MAVIGRGIAWKDSKDPTRKGVSKRTDNHLPISNAPDVKKQGGLTMPKSPNPKKRPTDVIGNAICVSQIATGEVEETEEDDGKDKAVQELDRNA